jgi:hypothetical protein
LGKKLPNERGPLSRAKKSAADYDTEGAKIQGLQTTAITAW